MAGRLERPAKSGGRLSRVHKSDARGTGTRSEDAETAASPDQWLMKLNSRGTFVMIISWSSSR